MRSCPDVEAGTEKLLESSVREEWMWVSLCPTVEDVSLRTLSVDALFASGILIGVFVALSSRGEEVRMGTRCDRVLARSHFLVCLFRRKMGDLAKSRSLNSMEPIEEEIPIKTAVGRHHHAYASASQAIPRNASWTQEGGGPDFESFHEGIVD